MDYYYAMKEVTGNTDALVFNCGEFYSNLEYQKQLISDFNKLFLRETVKLIQSKATMASLNTWVRDKKSTEIFNNAANDHLTNNIIDIQNEFEEFMKKHTI